MIAGILAGISIIWIFTSCPLEGASEALDTRVPLKNGIMRRSYSVIVVDYEPHRVKKGQYFEVEEVFL